MRWPHSYRYLTRLNAPISDADRLRNERVLALARTLLAVLLLVAIYLVNVARPGTSMRVVNLAVGPWFFYSCGLVAWLYSQENAPPGWLLHLIDMFWVTFITLMTQGPFFSLFVFALVAAGMRWGLWETMATVISSIVLLIVESIVFTTSLTTSTASFQDLLQGSFEVNRLLVRIAFMLVLGLLLGMSAEYGKERRAEAAMVNRLLHATRAEVGLVGSLQIVLSEMMRLFSARAAYVAVKERVSDRVLLWELDGGTESEHRPSVLEIPLGEADRYLLPELPSTCFWQNGHGVQMISLQGGTLRTRRLEAAPALGYDDRSIRSMLCVNSEIGGGWLARLVLIDASLGLERDRELMFAENLTRQATSALYSVFLLRQLRSQTGAMERAKVARELHDGAIQSLISAEMRVDVLRRKAERAASELTATELNEVQQLLRNEVLNLRELMHQMRPVDLSPEQFLDHIADSVDRFRRDTGIQASFISDLQEVNVSAHTCRELVRIVQEGLVNIRKHSRASHAIVNITRHPGGGLLLSISDNGCGFDFSGRIGHEELSSSVKGPTIIKERVRGIGGKLSIESMPGRGSRLEITLPPKGRSAHG